jgi:hypothetical protein
VTVQAAEVALFSAKIALQNATKSIEEAENNLASKGMESAIVLEWLLPPHADRGPESGRDPDRQWYFNNVPDAENWAQHSSHFVKNRYPHYTEVWSQLRGLIWLSQGDGLPEEAKTS